MCCQCLGNADDGISLQVVACAKGTQWAQCSSTISCDRLMVQGAHCAANSSMQYCTPQLDASQLWRRADGCNKVLAPNNAALCSGRKEHRQQGTVL